MQKFYKKFLLETTKKWNKFIFWIKRQSESVSKMLEYMIHNKKTSIMPKLPCNKINIHWKIWWKIANILLNMSKECFVNGTLLIQKIPYKVWNQNLERSLGTDPNAENLRIQKMYFVDYEIFYFV